MNQTKLFKILTIALIVLNVGIISFFFIGHRRGRHADKHHYKMEYRQKDKHHGFHHNKGSKWSNHGKKWMNKKGKSPMHMMTRELNLDSSQVVAVKALMKEHRKQIKEVDKELRANMRDYYSTLKDDSSSNEAEDLKSQIQALHLKKIEATYKHFADVKALLKEDQLDDFEDFVDRALKHVLAFNSPRSNKHAFACIN